MIFGIFRISGHSMMPTLKPVDRVVASSIPYLFSKPKVSDVVVLRYNDKPRTAAVRGKILVKRIVRIEDKKYFVQGDNKSDNLKIQPIERKEILGKIIISLKS